MAKAVWEGAVLAESDRCIEMEGNQYFPPDSLRRQHFKPCGMTTICSWKGVAKYYDIVVNGKVNAAGAWYYAEPKAAAREITNYVGFWNGVRVEH